MEVKHVLTLRLNVEPVPAVVEGIVDLVVN